jgi:hypothetical protein
MIFPVLPPKQTHLPINEDQPKITQSGCTFPWPEGPMKSHSDLGMLPTGGGATPWPQPRSFSLRATQQEGSWGTLRSSKQGFVRQSPVHPKSFADNEGGNPTRNVAQPPHAPAQKDERRAKRLAPPVPNGQRGGPFQPVAGIRGQPARVALQATSLHPKHGAGHCSHRASLVDSPARPRGSTRNQKTPCCHAARLASAALATGAMRGLFAPQDGGVATTSAVHVERCEGVWLTGRGS